MFVEFFSKLIVVKFQTNLNLNMANSLKYKTL